jgi:hypothetical protein
MGVTLLLLASFAAATQADGQSGEISGTAVNGTTGDVPLAGAEVVLRASQNGAFVPIAKTTTDAQGWFCFVGLPADKDVIYLPGINRAGVHYPGPRVPLTPEQLTARVKLVAYDSVPSPSPLISRRHEIAVQPGEGFLEVTETLVVENPSRTTFVGQSAGDRPPVTLRLSLPDGIEKVTFDREFHGRNFQLQDGKLITEIPWPPGSRELKFIYRVPVERTYSVFERVLDQPTDHVIVQVRAKDAGSIACNLPKGNSQSGTGTIYEHRGESLPAGYEINLRLGAVPLRFETYARWLAVAILVVLVGGSAVVVRARRQRPVTESGVPHASLHAAGAPGRRRRSNPRRTSARVK